MSYKRRSPQRLDEIESFLEEHYEKNGPQHCADILNEPKGYISHRACLIGLKYNNSDKFNSKVKRTSRKDRNEKRIEELMNINEKLRIENMKLISKNRKLIKDSDSKIVIRMDD